MFGKFGIDFSVIEKKIVPNVPHIVKFLDDCIELIKENESILIELQYILKELPIIRTLIPNKYIKQFETFMKVRKQNG